jgi:hypothetical protein
MRWVGEPRHCGYSTVILAVADTVPAAARNTKAVSKKDFLVLALIF